MSECINFIPLAHVYAACSLLWLLIWLLWYVNCKYFNSMYVRALHKMLTFTLGLKFFFSLSACLMNYTCKDTGLWEYWVLAYGCIYCLYNTFLYTALVLISKGYCFARDYFDREEIHMIALTTGGIYIAFCVYLMRQGYFILLIFITIMILWFWIRSNNSKIVFNLSQKIERMTANRLRSSLPAIKLKFDMMKKFSLLMNIYFCISVIVIMVTVYSLIKQNLLSLFWIIVHELFEVIGLGGVCFIFFPKYRGQYFDLPEFEGENENREVLPMYESDLTLVELPTNHESLPFLLKLPDEDMTNKNLATVMVALPMNLVHHRADDNELSQPLLARDFN